MSLIGGARGFTLAEVLLASAMTAIVALGSYTVLGTAVRVQEDLQQRGGARSEENAAALAMLHLAKHLETADRIKRVAADSLQVRMPPGPEADLDDTTLYRWDQYKHDALAKTLVYYRDGACGAPSVLAREVAGFTVDYRDVAPAPPGGEVFSAGPEDNNMLEYAVAWSDGTRSHTFRSTVAIRAAAYTDLNADAGDSGSGLLPAGMLDPPSAC